MRFLTKLGQVLLKVEAQMIGVSPLVKALLPPRGDAIVDQVQSELTQVAQVIVLVEAVGQKLQLPGAQKLEAAAPLVAKIILQSSALARHEVRDPVLFEAGCTKIASGMADVLNALKADGID